MSPSFEIHRGRDEDINDGTFAPNPSLRPKIHENDVYSGRYWRHDMMTMIEEAPAQRNGVAVHHEEGVAKLIP